jgi:membrane-associated phospholipid phosphatase
MDALYQLGINLILTLQGLGEWLYTPMRFFSLLAEEYFILIVIPIIYWSVSAEWGLRLGVYLMISGAVNNLTKLLLHGPRPFWLDSTVKAHIYESSFGIPSNHAQTSVVIFGTLAAWIHKTWAWVVAILLMFLVGLSRMYLGVHFVSDVVAGWLIGALLLWVLFRYEKRFLGWFLSKSTGLQLSIAFGTSIGLILLAALINLGFSGWEIPAVWKDNVTLAFKDEVLMPVSLAGVVTYASVLFGLAAGAIWIRTRGGFDAGGLWWKRVLRVLVGLVGAAVFYIGLDLVFPGGDSAMAYLLRYVRYGLVGFWAAGLAPVMFVALKLAEKKNA